MNSKNLPYWLKGGLIGFSIGVLITIILFLTFEGCNSDFGGNCDTPIQKFISFEILLIKIGSLPFIYLLNCSGEECWANIILGPILSIVGYSIYGLIIGLIYQKFKK